MFNVFEIGRGSDRLVPYDKTITVNNAPTTDTARLLKELEQEARNKVVASLEVNDNTFNWKGVAWRYEFKDRTLIVYGQFTINGTEFHFEGRVGEDEVHSLDKDQVLHVIYREIVHQITNLLMDSFIKRALLSIYYKS